MVVGIITGSGTYALPGFEQPRPQDVDTRFGTVTVTAGRFAGVEVLHVSRHGEGHVRLSNHVMHRANISALAQLGAQAIVGVTVCGAVDPTIELGSLIVFDDLHFLVNRLPDGSLCTLFDEPGDPGRGHWIIGEPFAAGLRTALLQGARSFGHPTRDGGCYGHVDGPRFNTRAEIRTLAAAGVTAVSQTGGPETVLAGEAEIPYALLGYATDYANGVTDEPTPVSELIRLMGESAGAFVGTLTHALPLLGDERLPPPGEVYRFAE